MKKGAETEMSPTYSICFAGTSPPHLHAYLSPPLIFWSFFYFILSIIGNTSLNFFLMQTENTLRKLEFQRKCIYHTKREVHQQTQTSA